MLEPNDHDLFRKLVDEHGRFVITTHMNPDGDALGSQIALARFLASRGCTVRLINQDATPGLLAFLERGGFRAELFDPAVNGEALEQADLVVLVDNSAPDRLGHMEQPMLAVADRTLCIDHHPTRATPWKHNILDQGACATAAVIHELTTRLGYRPDREAAEALYVGIATDTGFFRFNSTSPQAHRIAAELLDQGVSPARCYQEIYERNSEAYTRLLGHALSDLRLDGDGAVVSVRLTRELVHGCGAADVDTSEITTSLLGMDHVQVALLFRELDGGRIKVSLRSKGDVDVHRLATRFGGGGHRNASGIVVEGELDGVLREVIDGAVALVTAPREG
jgi:phosphoesterase RecJ-like protein